MHENNGFVNEKEFVFRLDGKRVGDLSNNLKYMIREIFGVYDDEEIVHSGLIDNYQKPDIFIEFRGLKKYISLKSGNAVNVAEEKVDLFIKYLRSKGISKESLKTILYYHFGDKTLNGTGEKRLEYHELFYLLYDRIKKLNEELNKNKQFVIDFVIRSIFKGTSEDNIEADYIYFGNVNYGVLCSKAQIIKHIQRKSWDFMDCPHIGPLLFRPHARYVNKEIKSEKRRNTVDIYWANLFADLTYISNRYDG